VVQSITDINELESSNVRGYMLYIIEFEERNIIISPSYFYKNYVIELNNRNYTCILPSINDSHNGVQFSFRTTYSSDFILNGTNNTGYTVSITTNQTERFINANNGSSNRYGSIILGQWKFITIFCTNGFYLVSDVQ
jgi:hypothetical protein